MFVCRARSLMTHDAQLPPHAQVPQQVPRDWLRGRGGGRKAKVGGWHALTNASAQPPSGTQPAQKTSLSVDSAADRPRTSNSGEFPSLDGRHADSGTPTAALKPARRQATSDQATEALSRDFARALAAPSPAPRPRNATKSSAAAQQKQQQQHLETALLVAHTWAGRELVQAVVAGVGGDARAAGACLDEMLAAHLQQRRRSSDTSANGRQPSDREPTAAVLSGTGSLQATSLAEPADDHELAADLAEEPYTHHRGDAIRLTHSWQRGMRRAAAAFAAGDKGVAHSLARSARLKRQVLFSY